MSGERKPRNHAWVAEGAYFADCQTCKWTSGDTPPSHVAARAMDHARRNSHQVLTFRSVEYDFRRSRVATTEGAE